MLTRLIREARLTAIYWLARRLPTCREMAPVFSQSLDRQLGLRESIEAKLHLLICSYCVRYLKQLRFLRAAFRCGHPAADERHINTPSLSAESRERLKEALRRARL